MKRHIQVFEWITISDMNDRKVRSAKFIPKMDKMESNVIVTIHPFSIFRIATILIEGNCLFFLQINLF